MGATLNGRAILPGARVGARARARARRAPVAPLGPARVPPSAPPPLWRLIPLPFLRPAQPPGSSLAGVPVRRPKGARAPLGGPGCRAAPCRRARSGTARMPVVRERGEDSAAACGRATPRARARHGWRESVSREVRCARRRGRADERGDGAGLWARSQRCARPRVCARSRTARERCARSFLARVACARLCHRVCRPEAHSRGG